MNTTDLYERKYGVRAGGTVLAAAVSLLKRHYKPTENPLNILDVGSGNMSLSMTFLDLLRAAIPSGEIHIQGWDISRKGVMEAREKGFAAEVRDICGSLDAQLLPKYDMILFFEVLEHVPDTDAAIRNIHDLLKPGGILVMSTPNLASWYNRIFLLFGNQPHCTEVSHVPIRFGNRIVHRLLGERCGVDDIAVGHLRVFTWKALREFLRHYGFTVLAARGCANHKHDLISRLICPIFPGLSGDVCLLARRAADEDERLKREPL